MQTIDKSGIICDYCGLTNTSDFIYYSFDFRAIQVNNNHIPNLEMILNTGIVVSYDICMSCYTQLSQKVVDNYKKIKPKQGAKRNSSHCELTGNVLTGTYDYYYCVVTKVNVHTTGQPNVCVDCQKTTLDVDKPCQCGSVNFVRPALINTTKRFLEFSVCEEVIQTFRKKAETVRARPSQWTTDT